MFASSVQARQATRPTHPQCSPLTERWLGPPVTLPPGTGECLQVPAPATGVSWRIILLSSNGWKDQWNRLMVRLRFGPGLREERTFSDWIEE
jgi:hypothetical protein